LRRQLLQISLAFILGIAFANFVGKLIYRGIDKVLFPEHRTEIARVTSPDGAVDAVMMVSNCGAPCSNTYSVIVVPKGRKVPDDSVQYVFSADDMVNPQVSWKQAHLLEIAYAKAFINAYRNVSSPFGVPGNVESWDYEDEIRLAPSSPDFSYLPENKRIRR